MKVATDTHFDLNISPDTARRFKAYLDERIRRKREAQAQQADADAQAEVAR